MTSKRLWICFGALLGMLAAYNTAIHLGARKSQHGRLLARIESIPPGTDCVFLGNSLVEAGCDMSAFQSAWPNPGKAPSAINLALGGTSPVEHCLILKHALKRLPNPKCLIYGFFDDELNAPAEGKWRDLVGNRALSYRFPEEAAAFYWPGSRLGAWQMRIAGHIPMLAERSLPWGKVELLRRRLEDIGMPKQKTNRFGRTQDFAALEPKDLTAFNSRCEAALGNRKGFSAPVQEIIRLAQERGAKVILVEMPMPSRHRQTFYSSPSWARMQDYLQSLAARQQALYISAGDWIANDGCFEDATHLNEKGAQIFSHKLALAIASDMEVSGFAETEAPFRD
jgi:hypothetical protein